MIRFVLLLVCLVVTEGRNIQRFIRGKLEIFVVLSFGSHNNFDAIPFTCSERVSLKTRIPTKLIITRKIERNAQNITWGQAVRISRIRTSSKGDFSKSCMQIP